MKTSTVQMVSVQEWDKLVMETYGRVYSFQQQNGCRDRGIFTITVPSQFADDDFENDTVPEVVNGKEMGVSFKAWLERDPKQPIENQEYDYQRDIWWERNFYPDIHAVANDLHKKGLLEAGEYTINIDW